MPAAAIEPNPIPIVLLHGATSSCRIWDPVLPLLGTAHHVYAPTLAAHRGGPPLPTGPGTAAQRIVDATCHQLDDAGIDTAHLVGNSFGGVVALELARRGRAQSVLALSPAAAWRAPRDLRRLLVLLGTSSILARGKDLSHLARYKRLRRILMLLMAEHADRMQQDQVIDTFRDIAECRALPGILNSARVNGPTDFADITCPLLVAWGMHDRLLPFMRYGAPLLIAAPAAHFKILPGVGHVPMIDDPALTARTILEFVNDISAETAAATG